MRPLTVLIGQNDTGKSGFMRALRVLADHTQWQYWDFPEGDNNTQTVIAG